MLCCVVFVDLYSAKLYQETDSNINRTLTAEQQHQQQYQYQQQHQQNINSNPLIFDLLEYSEIVWRVEYVGSFDLIFLQF